MNHARYTIDSDVRPEFTACYLRTAGDECAFVEAHTSHATPRLLAALADHGMKPEQVRWVVVTHAHLDHAAGASALVEACPNATLVAHPRAARHLIDPSKLVASATEVYGQERFAKLYGTIRPIPKERVKTLADGETIPLGDATLRALHTAGHANHHFAVDDPATDTVFTGDTFGLVYPPLQKFGRFALPSTSPTNFDAALAKESVARILALGRRFVAPTHFDAWDDAGVIGAQLVRFLDRAAAWVEEGAKTDEPFEVLSKTLSAKWREAILEEAPKFGERELEFLSLDMELNGQGLAVAAIAHRPA